MFAVRPATGPPVRDDPVVVRWITHRDQPLEQAVRQIPRRAARAGRAVSEWRPPRFSD